MKLILLAYWNSSTTENKSHISHTHSGQGVGVHLGEFREILPEMVECENTYYHIYMVMGCWWFCCRLASIRLPKREDLWIMPAPLTGASPSAGPVWTMFRRNAEEQFSPELLLTQPTNQPAFWHLVGFDRTGTQRMHRTLFPLTENVKFLVGTRREPSHHILSSYDFTSETITCLLCRCKLLYPHHYQYHHKFWRARKYLFCSSLL